MRRRRERGFWEAHVAVHVAAVATLEARGLRDGCEIAAGGAAALHEVLGCVSGAW